MRLQGRGLGAARAHLSYIQRDGVQRDGSVGVLYSAGEADGRAFLERCDGDRHFLIVDGVDGRVHHVDLGSGDAVEPLPEGAIVRVRLREVGPRASDRTVAEIADASGGSYSVDLHLRHDPEARPDFAEAHIRRLEALRRAGVKLERREDGTWRIEANHLEQAAVYERRRARSAPVRIELVSPVPLKELPERDGATWLDQELADDSPEPLRDSGFGREVRSALALRRQWLLSQGLGEEVDGSFAVRPGSVAALRQREVSAAAARLSGELGLSFAPAEEGGRIEGVLRRRVDLASGRFALVENGRDFTLVPWRPVLERHMGREVSGVARQDGIGWTIGRARGNWALSRL